MAERYDPVDLRRLKVCSVRDRSHKAVASRAASLPSPGASAAELIASFPNYLGAAALRRVVEAVVAAKRAERPVVAAFGAHLIKVGCAPILIDLIQRGVITAIATNGAGAIHDVEIAEFGETSEEVADTIRSGMFGMVSETFAFFDEAAKLAERENIGLGAAVGRLLRTRSVDAEQISVFAAAAAAGIPACVHVALGTDTVHMSPGADGAAIGRASLHDFRVLCSVVADLGGGSRGVGGVWLNIGSAVVLPEVFLKAVSVARNLGADLSLTSSANFDMIRHYRPNQNVVTRPVSQGRGHEVIGHHEILLPLLRQAVVERLSMRD